MKILPFAVFGFFILLSANSFSQIDIYQSDAYSVEEMCARQAAETSTTDYNTAYEACIEKNRDRPMYRSDAHNAEDKLAGESGSGSTSASGNGSGSGSS